MLVAPKYTFIPREERILEFKGYNKKSVIEDGEMRNMYNLASDEFPCLYQRKPRGVYAENYVNPTAMLVKNEKLAVISESKFYYDGVLYPQLQLSENTKMVAINTRICFFPEKKYFNVKTNEIGDLSASAAAAGCSVTITTSTITFPEEMGFNTVFAVGDAVEMKAADDRLNISAVIQSMTASSITFPEETFISVIAEGKTETSIEVESIEIARNCPDLDFVMESNNRLWGVSNADNTIYACKLGDPTNWGYFQNTTLDSYYAEQGTDGEWTGCAAYSSHLLFFKEDCIHKVYGSKPSAYQIETAQCHALEKGSHKSVTIINETVLYKSRLGIMAYSGGIPQLISDNLGTDKYTDAIAGTDGMKYFVSVLREGSPELLVFDMERFLWHKEDSVRVRDFAYHNGKLLFINESNNMICEMASDKPLETEKDIEWFAELGPFDEYIEDHKVYSKLKMRLKFAENSKLKVMISVDEGEWEPVESYDSVRDRAVMLPIVPRRCEKFAVRFEGTGYCKIESLVRSYRKGTGRKDVK